MRQGLAFGGTKEAEFRRTAEMIPEILAKYGVKYVIWFLIDSGYQNNDLKEIVKYLPEERIKALDKL